MTKRECFNRNNSKCIVRGKKEALFSVATTSVGRDRKNFSSPFLFIAFHAFQIKHKYADDGYLSNRNLHVLIAIIFLACILIRTIPTFFHLLSSRISLMNSSHFLLRFHQGIRENTLSLSRRIFTCHQTHGVEGNMGEKIDLI